jgi:hypothetical protein
MWPILRELNERYQLGAEFREAELTVKINDTEIQLYGADMVNFIDRLRGGKYPIVCIDEAASFREHLTTLVDDILTPAIADYNGQIILVGSAGIVPKGLFYDATELKKYGFSIHKWTVFNNPFMPNARAFVDMIKERKSWTDENPTYRREWLNEWVQDLDALVYKFEDGNIYEDIPEDREWYNIIGVDFGWHDQAAFTVLAYNPHSPKVYVHYSKGFSHMIPSKIAEHVSELNKRFKPIRIVADTGGLGKSIAEEMIQRWGLPIFAAEKTQKLTNISLMNGDFVDGHLLVHSSLVNLHNQLKTLQKDDKGMEDPGFPNDLCDSMLYAYREAKAYAWTPIKDKPKNQKEKWEREAETLLERDLEEHENKSNKVENWWEQ